MKTKLATMTVLIGALMIPVAALPADGDSDRSSMRSYVKDSVITTKIKAEFAKDPLVSALHIKVDTDKKGIVALSGKAKSQEEADKAVQIARNVEGVHDVHSRIRISSER